MPPSLPRLPYPTVSCTLQTHRTSQRRSWATAVTGTTNLPPDVKCPVHTVPLVRLHRLHQLARPRLPQLLILEAPHHADVVGAARVGGADLRELGPQLAVQSGHQRLVPEQVVELITPHTDLEAHLLPLLLLQLPAPLPLVVLQLQHARGLARPLELVEHTAVRAALQEGQNAPAKRLPLGDLFRHQGPALVRKIIDEPDADVVLQLLLHLQRRASDRAYGVVWCGVVWCGVVWCGVVWCGVVWCGVVWCGVVWCGVVWCGVVWCGVVWCGVVWCGVVWCGVVWCGVVWCGVVWCGVVWCGVVWCGGGGFWSPLLFDEEDPLSEPEGNIAASSSEPTVGEFPAFPASNSEDVPQDGKSVKGNVKAGHAWHTCRGVAIAARHDGIGNRHSVELQAVSQWAHATTSKIGNKK